MSTNIIIRVSDEDKALYNKAAERAGVSLSKWIKGLCDVACDERLVKPDVTPAKVSPPQRAVKGSSVNVPVVGTLGYTGVSVFKFGRLMYEMADGSWTATGP